VARWEILGMRDEILLEIRLAAAVTCVGFRSRQEEGATVR